MKGREGGREGGRKEGLGNYYYYRLKSVIGD